MVYLCKFQSLDEKEKMRFNMSLISKLFYQILRRNLSKRAIPQGFSSTHNIANKGFSDMRRFAARFNFSCTLIGNHPQSLTGHTANR
jgi:hypothetical protein